MRFGFGALERHSHRVEVVLAHEQHRQLPQRRQVHAFVERAFVYRAVTEEAGGDRAAFQHLVTQRGADGERQPATYDGVAAIEACGAVEDVHRTTAPAAAAFQLAVHFGHQPFMPMPRASAWPCSR